MSQRQFDKNKAMNRKRLVLITLIILAIGGYVGYQIWQPSQFAAADAALVPLTVDEDLEGFARAIEPGGLEFPRDLGPHEDYRTEWWYYTGNLVGENGREFGYQLTFFRRGLTPPTDEMLSDNEWRSNQVYMAHFTISDIANDAFYPHERFSRDAVGLAGAQAAPYRVWVEDWSAEEMSGDSVRLVADGGDVALDLMLTQTLHPVLHGKDGLSIKGEEPGVASYYYSLVQQETVGQVRIGDEIFEVTGKSWKDHEYSTQALSGNVQGWDWFSVQLDNGTSLMFFEIRNEDGSIEPFSSGSFVDENGRITPLTRNDWQITVTDTWTSDVTGATYPAGWQIEVPALEIELAASPMMLNQELIVSTVYWEGAVQFEGTMQSQVVTGRGYVEMTGYFATMRGRL